MNNTKRTTTRILTQAIAMLAVGAAAITLVVACSCGAQRDEGMEQTAGNDSDDTMIGKRLHDEVTADDLKSEFNASMLREYRTGEMLTTDFIPDRLNVELDEQGRIVALWMDTEGAPRDFHPDDEQRRHNDEEADDHESDISTDNANDTDNASDSDNASDTADDRPSGSQLTQQYAGQHLGVDVTEEEIAATAKATVVRVHGPDDMLTMDYSPDRINIVIDEQDNRRILAIWRDDEGRQAE